MIFLKKTDLIIFVKWGKRLRIQNVFWGIFMQDMILPGINKLWIIIHMMAVLN